MIVKHGSICPPRYDTGMVNIDYGYLGDCVRVWRKSLIFWRLLAQQSLHNCNVNLLPVRDLYLAFVTNFSVTSSIRLLFFSLELESVPCSNMPRKGQNMGIYSHKLIFSRPLRLTAPRHPPYFHGPMSSIAGVTFANVKAAQSRHPCNKNTPALGTKKPRKCSFKMLLRILPLICRPMFFYENDWYCCFYKENVEKHKFLNALWFC